jgi:hypothetical protein
LHKKTNITIYLSQLRLTKRKKIPQNQNPMKNKKKQSQFNKKKVKSIKNNKRKERK